MRCARGLQPITDRQRAALWTVTPTLAPETEGGRVAVLSARSDPSAEARTALARPSTAPRP